MLKCCFTSTDLEDVPLVQFMYLIFTRMPGESYRRRLRSLLLCWCYVFRALITPLACKTLNSSRMDYSIL